MLRSMLLAAVVLMACALPVTAAAEEGDKIDVLIITGDHGHQWQETTPFLKDLLGDAGMAVAVTETPAKDLTPENLAKYDVLLLNYKDTNKGGPDTKWSDANKRAFADAVRGGTGLVVYHHASSAFIAGDAWSGEFEEVIAGGWRKQGHHGKRHEFDVFVTDEDHPITRGVPTGFAHANDELYQNSVVPPGAVVLATSWSDKRKDPKNTDKHEPAVWVTQVGQGRVCNNVLGHDVPAMKDSPGFQALLVRCVEWAATGDVKTSPPSDLPKPRDLSAAPEGEAAGKK